MKKVKILILLIGIFGLLCGCNVTKIKNEENITVPPEKVPSVTPIPTMLKESDGKTEGIDSIATKENVVITWIIPNLLKSGEVETNVARLNKKLQEDGYGLTLEIKSYSIRTYREDIIPVLESGEADIVSVGMDMADGTVGYAQDFIREGYLEELSDYLESEEGCDLRNWYHKDEWKRIETDGQIYVLPSQNNVYGTGYFAFNKKYVTEEMLEGFTGAPGELNTIISSLQLSTDVKEIIGEPSISSTYPLCGVVEEKGIFYSLAIGTAENPFLNNKFYQYAKEWNSLYQAGRIHIFTGLEAEDLERQVVREGDFVVWISYGKDAFYEDIKDSVYVIPIEQAMVNALSGTSGISKNSEKKAEAMRLLTLLYTNETYSNLLLFGEEGTDFQRIDGYVCDMSGESMNNYTGSYVFGTLDTAYPCKTDLIVVDKNGTQDDFFESEYYLDSAILGFQPDCTGFSKDMKNAMTILDSYSQIWKEADFDAVWAKAAAEFEAAGGNELVEELNRQVKEWKQNTGN